MSDNPDPTSDWASIGSALGSALADVLDELGLAGASSKELARELAIDHTTARRLTRMLAEGDPLLALTRAPKPAAFSKVAAHARNKDIDEATFSVLRAAASRFDKAIMEAGSKARLTTHIRLATGLTDDEAGENLSADLG